MVQQHSQALCGVLRMQEGKGQICPPPTQTPHCTARVQTQGQVILGLCAESTAAGARSTENPGRCKRMVGGRLPLWLFAIASLQEAGRSRLKEERR